MLLYLIHLKPGKVITHVVCKDDATQSYALYIPAKEDKETLPVIYFFDPHGDGSLSIEQIQIIGRCL